jgi:hypothetical protein
LTGQRKDLTRRRGVNRRHAAAACDQGRARSIWKAPQKDLAGGDCLLMPARLTNRNGQRTKPDAINATLQECGRKGQMAQGVRSRDGHNRSMGFTHQRGRDQALISGQMEQGEKEGQEMTNIYKCDFCEQVEIGLVPEDWSTVEGPELEYDICGKCLKRHLLPNRITVAVTYEKDQPK